VFGAKQLTISPLSTALTSPLQLTQCASMASLTAGWPVSAEADLAPILREKVVQFFVESEVGGGHGAAGVLEFRRATIPTSAA